MKSSQKGFVATALLVIVAAMFVTGGVYIYSKTQSDRAKDELISSAQKNVNASRPTEQILQISADLAWARTRLQMETTKLQEIKQQSLAAQILNSTLRDTYLKISDAITGKTDIFFTNPKSLKPNLVLNTPGAVENKINATRAQIGQILSSWQALVSAGSSPQNTTALQNAINHDLPIVNAYLGELTTIVNNLTPGNSGLTQQEITEYQTTVNNAVGQVTNAATTLATVEAQVTTGNTSSVSQTNVQTQQEVVNQIQQEIQNLQQQLEQGQTTGNSSGNNQPINQIEAVTQASTTSSGYYGETDSVIQSTSGQIIYPPNPAPTRPPRPPTDHDLIEGTNTGQ